MKNNQLELKDTIDFMNSIDYKERFIAEYWQLKIRLEKLTNFCDRIEAKEEWDWNVKQPMEKVEHTCPLRLLRNQQRTMEELLHWLGVRAELEKIDLNSIFKQFEDKVYSDKDTHEFDLLNKLKEQVMSDTTVQAPTRTRRKKEESTNGTETV